MRFFLTLLALVAGLATPGMTLANARAEMAGAEQVETSGMILTTEAAVGTVSPLPRTPAAATRASVAPIVACLTLAGCSIALSDRPLE